MILEKIKTSILLWVLTVTLVFGLGFSLGNRSLVISRQNNLPAIKIVNRESQDQTVDFSLFWQVWQILNQKSVEQPLKGPDLLYGAIRGLAASLKDPYTLFLTPAESKDLSSSLNGEYEGIGAELGYNREPQICGPEISPNQLIIVTPLDGSPALGADLRRCDAILKIDDKPTSNLTITDAVHDIKGPAGTEVALTIRRKNDDPFVVKIKRAKIMIPSVKWENKGGGVIDIRLSRFGQDTNDDWDKAVSEIESSLSASPQAVVLDLRGNPGGYFDSAVYVASEFLPKGSLVSAKSYADGHREESFVERVGKYLKVPVVVLADGGSASAAEILAAALRDGRGAKLVGEKTFGKGSVQESVDLADGSAVHVTVAKWLTPKGEIIHGKGLEADVKVPITEADINSKSDPQLDKALELARKLTK